MPMAKQVLNNYIGGQWVKGEGVNVVTDPYTGAELGRVTLATPKQVEQALKAASAAFEIMRQLPSRLRAELLWRVRERIAADRDKLAQLICAEAGKPITFARGEVSRALETVQLSAEEARRLNGEYLPLDLVPGADSYQGMVRRVPRGPATALWPFNFPLNLLWHKLGPALAAGCPVLMRPPSDTPLTGHRVAQYFADECRALELPLALVQYVACSHSVATPLVEDPRIKALSFTGSDEVGWELKRRANKKQVMLELGGQASLIVEPDAPDLKWAANRAALGAFAFAGQVCISVQRVMVNRRIADKFVPLFLKEVKALKTGDPRNPRTTVGPLINAGAADKIKSWVEEAVAKGARLLTGHRRKKQLLTPHVLQGVKKNTQLYKGEVFGPVAVLEYYRTLADAVRMTNASRYGLQSAVFTRDIDKVLAAWRDVDVGGLVVNDYPTFRVDHMPYGGVKDSGFGREGVRYAVQEYTEPRLLAIRSPGK